MRRRGRSFGKEKAVDKGSIETGEQLAVLGDRALLPEKF